MPVEGAMFHNGALLDVSGRATAWFYELLASGQCPG